MLKGKDAIMPFIVESPCKIYNETKIEVDALFTFASAVSVNQLLGFVCSGCLFRDFIAIIFFLLIFEQEFILFYSAEHVKIAELSQLDKNFNFVLPFRGPKLAFDSPVSLPNLCYTKFLAGSPTKSLTKFNFIH